MTTPKQAFSNAPSIGGVASGASRSAPDWERIELDYRAHIKSLRDIAVTGSNVVSDAGTTLQAGRDVTIAAAQETSSEQHYRKETKSGIFGGGGGIGFTIGSRMQSADQTGTRTTAAASTVGSVGGDVNIVAGNAYKQVGSDVMAPGSDVNVVTKEVQIVEARETGSSATEQRFKQSGLSVSIGSPVISAIQTAATISAVASGGSAAGAATAFNADMNNRQLHAIDKINAKNLSAKSNGRSSVEKIEEQLILIGTEFLQIGLM
ncbi:hemagglutinin repeat-containing protein [Comamonas testosteroni]|uniref:hemagglutinin repeat-containing protein n=1 Tax=Comamonas testosteroni TaxID=285 RepID=UPI0006B95AAE|nr:hemagglutinin repeat-containing protein [Comamonas testosteroni]